MKEENDIGIDVDVGMDRMSDMAVSVNLGVLEMGSYRAPLKGFGVDLRQVFS